MVYMIFCFKSFMYPPLIYLNSNNKYEWTKCSKNKSIAFTYLDKSIGESIEYTIDFQAAKYLDNSQGAQEINILKVTFKIIISHSSGNFFTHVM